jgi:DNA-binding MarR family transcriptional regulator
MFRGDGRGADADGVPDDGGQVALSGAERSFAAFAEIHHGMGVSTARVFLAVATHPGTTVTEIACATGLPLPRVSAEVSALAALDESSVLSRILRRGGTRVEALLRFGSDGGDRRRKPLFLSDSGNALAARVADTLRPATREVEAQARARLAERLWKVRALAAVIKLHVGLIARDLGAEVAGYGVSANADDDGTVIYVEVTRDNWTQVELRQTYEIHVDGDGSPTSCLYSPLGGERVAIGLGDVTLERFYRAVREKLASLCLREIGTSRASEGGSDAAITAEALALARRNDQRNRQLLAVEDRIRGCVAAAVRGFGKEMAGFGVLIEPVPEGTALRVKLSKGGHPLPGVECFELQIDPDGLPSWSGATAVGDGDTLDCFSAALIERMSSIHLASMLQRRSFASGLERDDQT